MNGNSNSKRRPQPLPNRETPARSLDRTSLPVSPAGAKIRILVGDGQAIDRGGLVGMLNGQPDFTVVGEGASVDEVIEQCRSLRPDMLLMSLHLPGEKQAPALSVIRTALPDLRILVLSERSRANCLVLNPPGRRSRKAEPLPACAEATDCLELAAVEGALGTLRRSADPEDLFRAIRAVAAGMAYYDPDTASSLVLGKHGVESARARSMTGRELQVASLLADGFSNKEIADTLGVSEPTVKKHVGHIFGKLGLQDRLQAGLYLARNPLILEDADRQGI